MRFPGMNGWARFGCPSGTPVTGTSGRSLSGALGKQRLPAPLQGGGWYAFGTGGSAALTPG
jgi:hypothetical protein